MMKTLLLKIVVFWTALICSFSAETMAVENKGTLVVMIPTNDGIIVASDTRSHIAGITFDGEPKVTIISKGTAFAITGTFEILPKPPIGTDLKDWVPRAPRLISFSDLVEDHLTNHPTSVSSSTLNSLGNFLANNLEKYLTEWPQERIDKAGKNLCQVVIVQYEPISRESRFGVMHVGVSSSGHARTANERVMKFGGESEPPFLRFGESTYLNEEVLSKKDKSLLPPMFFELGAQTKKIKALSYTGGAFMAHALIEAASERAKEVPPRTPIGGPTYVTLIDGVRTPIQLKPENGFAIEPKN